MCYVNQENGMGTHKDSSMSYTFNDTSLVSVGELLQLYESNGLFANIIDRPAADAVEKGFDVKGLLPKKEKYIFERLEMLDFEDAFITAEKWSRLFGGSLIVMHIEDGRELSEPLDIKHIKCIGKLHVIGANVAEPVQQNVYKPEKYKFSIDGTEYIVHESRCLVFKNNDLPEALQHKYRFWGFPEYIHMKNELRRCITSHSFSSKLLEDYNQGIYKMDGLARILATEEGEEAVYNRLKLIDEARNLLNIISVDLKESYEIGNNSIDFKGAAEIIRSTYAMVSAVSGIPQSILFGRNVDNAVSDGQLTGYPGRADREAYNGMIESIQRKNIRPNIKKLVNVLMCEAKIKGENGGSSHFEIRMKSLENSTQLEQAETQRIKAETQRTRAKTAALYFKNGVISRKEAIRNGRR